MMKEQVQFNEVKIILIYIHNYTCDKLLTQKHWFHFLLHFNSFWVACGKCTVLDCILNGHFLDLTVAYHWFLGNCKDPVTGLPGPVTGVLLCESIPWGLCEAIFSSLPNHWLSLPYVLEITTPYDSKFWLGMWFCCSVTNLFWGREINLGKLGSRLAILLRVLYEVVSYFFRMLFPLIVVFGLDSWI